MKTVLKYLKRYSFRVVCGVLIKFSAAVCELFIPLLLERIIDISVPAQDVYGIRKWGLIMVALSFGAVICNITANIMAAWVSLEVTRKIRGELYFRINALSEAQLDKYSQASLCSRLTNDTYNLHQMFDKIQRGGIRTPMLVIGGLIISFVMEPVLASVLLGVCVLTCFTVYFFTKNGIPLFTNSYMAVDTFVRIIRENASGVRVIRALGMQNKECDRFSKANADACKKEEKASVLMAATNPLTGLVLSIGLTLIVLIGAYRVNEGLTMPGQIVAFLSYFTLIQTATIGMTKVFVKISKGAASARRIEEILVLPYDQKPEEDSTQYPTFIGMEEVDFSYLGVENNISKASFKIEKGQTLGIMGPTGSGKTTLVSLLLRGYDAKNGVVWVGGENVKSADKRLLNERFGVVFQNSALLTGTIYENISFLRNIDRDKCICAAKTAQAYEFIEKLPQGMDSKVDIRGNNLSGGQKQRLCVARALATKPEILVLDSADSALDYRTASALYKAIKKDLPDTTLIVITERVAPMKDANRILLLHDGNIFAQGTHEELLKISDRYERIVKLQEGGILD